MMRAHDRWSPVANGAWPAVDGVRPASGPAQAKRSLAVSSGTLDVNERGLAR